MGRSGVKSKKIPTAADADKIAVGDATLEDYEENSTLFLQIYFL